MNILNAQPPYQKHWLLLGGMGFGLYFTLGFFYFETFHWGSANVLNYLPVFFIFGVQCSLLALMLFGKSVTVQRDSRISPGLIILPLVTFTAAGLAAWVYAGIAGPTGFMLASLGQLFRDLLLVGLLPVAAVLVLLQGKKQPVPLKSENLPEVPNTSASSPTPAAELLVLPQGASSPAFEIPLAQFVLAEAADNYCKIHYLSEAELKMDMIRISLKEVEQAVDGRGHFFRCHRSFLVNGKQVEKVTGNSQAYKLIVTHYPDSVPVSRSFDLSPIRSLIS